MQAKCLVMEDTELQCQKYNTFTVLYVFIVVWTYQVTIMFMFGIGCIHIRNFFLKNILNTHTSIHIYWEWHVSQGRFHRFILHTHNHQILYTFRCPGICKSVHHETNLMLHKCLYNYNDFCMYLHFSLTGKVSKLHGINCARYFGNIRLCGYNLMSVAYTNGSSTTINLQPNPSARICFSYIHVCAWLFALNNIWTLNVLHYLKVSLLHRVPSK